jgi:uncharacterized protein YrrD
MLKGDTLLGKSVLAYNTNQKMAHVQGALIDYDTNRLAAFWVIDNAPKRQVQVLPWSGVKIVEVDRVVAWSANMLASAQDMFSIRRLLERETIRPGMKFITTKQHDLGTMVDFYFDENTGVLDGYEIIGGIFALDANDHSFLPAPGIISIAGKVVLVPASTVNAMQELPGGLPMLLQQLKAQIKAEETATLDWLIRHLFPRTEGLRVQHSIVLRNGAIMAARGQVITAALIQRAQELQAERQIIESVGINIDALLHEVNNSANDPTA